VGACSKYGRSIAVFIVYMQGVLRFEEQLRCVKDCLCVEKDAHAVTRAELDLCKARVAKLRAMARNQGREPMEKQYMASDVYLDGDDMDPDTAKVEFAAERDIRLNIATECVGNNVAEETGKGKQLLGVVTMAAASEENATHGSE